MKTKETLGTRIFNFFNILFMILLMIISFYPLYYVACASFSAPINFMGHTGLLLWPDGFSLSSYQTVIRNPSISSGYLNTIFIVVVGVALSILLTSMGAYFLSRKRIMLRNGIMFFAVFTMFFNGGLIPFYLTIRDLHIDNTLWSLIFPSAVSTFNLIIMRTAFMAIPESLEESAKLDGAGHFTILFKIIMPLSMPTIAVMVLFYGVGQWNAWFNASLFIRNSDLFPLQLVLRSILIANDTNSMMLGQGDREMISDTIKYAVIMVATVPILLLYPFLQRYFIKGIMIGAIKE
jgi:putative aldouronate transport system permease protein